MNKILYLTDLNYVAKGRNYYEEDIYLTGRLREHFDVALCHPACSESFEREADMIVFKNGIQRVDACRTRDGRLLLIELEDLNPYLSLLELDEKTRETFVADMVNALKKYLL